MPRLVSLEHASDWIRRDPEAPDDALLTGLIEAASAAVINYLGASATSGTRAFLDSDGEVDYDSDDAPLDVPPEVETATLLLIAEWYCDREAGSPATEASGYLPQAVVSILYPLRDPALA